jgi:phosphopantetheinyl transferase (holo-ACP synthase)
MYIAIFADGNGNEHRIQALQSEKTPVVIVMCGEDITKIKEVAKIIKKDLEFTDQFVVDQVYIPSCFTKEDFKKYGQKERFLIILTNSQQDKGMLEWRLYAYTDKESFIKGVETSPINSVEWWSHSIADEIYKQLTGESSPFLSKIVYCKENSGVGNGNSIWMAHCDGSHAVQVIPLKSVKKSTQLTTYMAPCWAFSKHKPQLLYSEYTPVNVRLMVTDFINTPVIVTDFDGINVQQLVNASFGQQVEKSTPMGLLSCAADCASLPLAN